MSVFHDAVAALPTSAPTVKVLLRNLVTTRLAYVLADAEDSRNLVTTDPSTGVTVVDLVLLGRDFHFDPADTTTAHDGTSCLVSSEGHRYKLASGTDVFAYAVINITTATPPGSPTLGDAYLVAAGATGAWAGKSNQIAVKTARGWEFLNFGIGRFVYNEATDTYYHKNTGGAWVSGLGNGIFAANSVPLSAAINFGKRVIVENQTTTVAPGSPTVGTAYIIGPSATGAWAGLDGKVAICEVAGTFVIYTPTAGWLAFDKAQGIDFLFSGSAWTTTANVVTRINAATYNVTSVDNNRTLSFFGGAFQAAIFPAASSLPAGFRCTIYNEETTPVGKGIGGINVGSFTLYPGYGYSVGIVNNTVVLLDGGLRPYKASSIALFAHSSLGSDNPLVADGFADGTRAFASGAAMKAALYSMHHNGSQPVCKSTGTFPGLTFGGQPPGCGVFFWNGSAPGAYQVNQTGNACFIIGDGAVCEMANVTFEGGGVTSTAFQMHQTAICDLLSGCTFNNFGGGTHVGSDGAGWSFNVDAGYTVGNGGNAGTHMAASGSGIITVTGSITITINGGPAPVMTNWHTQSGATVISLGSAITYVGSPQTGTRKWQGGPQAWISTSGNTIPGSVAGSPAIGSAPTSSTGWAT